MRSLADASRRLVRAFFRSRDIHRSRPVDERQLRDAAARASSWMAPWERAQMDAPRRPLAVWEKIYWRLFVVFGGVGLVYETYVLENHALLPSARQRFDTRRAEAAADSVSAAMWASAGGKPFAGDASRVDGLDRSCAIMADEHPFLGPDSGSRCPRVYLHNGENH
jgi:hypothetical protein